MNSKVAIRYARPVAAWVFGMGGMLLMLAWVAGFFGTPVPANAPLSPLATEALADWTTVAVSQEVVPVVERFAGTVRPAHEALLAPRLLARVADVTVRAGDRVTTGQTLVVLDARDLRARTAQAREAVAAAEAALTNNEAEYLRVRSLVESGVQSQSTLDRAEATWRSSQAALEGASQRVNESEAALSDAVVAAPFAGIVIDRLIEPGDTAAPGLPVLKIYDPTRMRLEAYVRESLAVTLKPGDRAAVRIEALGSQMEGVVTEIVPQSEVGSRSFLIKVELSAATEGLYPGLFGRLEIPSGTRTRIAVPERALERVGQLVFVRLAEPRGARRLVVPGASEVGMTEILSGLSAGTSILMPTGSSGTASSPGE